MAPIKTASKFEYPRPSRFITSVAITCLGKQTEAEVEQYIDEALQALRAEIVKELERQQAEIEAQEARAQDPNF